MGLFDEPSKQPLPRELTPGDHRFAVIKGTLSSIPGLGSVLAEEMGIVLVPPLTRRRDAWFEDIARRLHEIESRVAGFRFEDLGNNEQFVSAMVQATQSAIKTHATEKLEALRNAVLNVALGNAPADDLQSIFLNLVDSFTPVHLQLLRFFQHPNFVDRERFRSERWASDQATVDLLSRGLIRDTRPIAARGRDSEEALVIGDWPASTLGKQFLELVSNPPQLATK
jgi:hypothetical protein